MTPANAKLLPALLIPLLAWQVYRRFRRNVGRQAVRRGRLIFGIVLFAVISLGSAAVCLSAPKAEAAVGGGLALGVVLGFVGIRLTRFDNTSEGHFYTPNTYIGVALSLLLAARIVYRFGALYLGDMAAMSASSGAPSVVQNPLTFFILCLTAGYYVTFNSGVLVKSAHLRSEQSSP